MRWAICVLAVAVLGGSVAGAAPDDLSGGALITHYVPGLVYTEGVTWCDSVETHPITDPDSANVRIDTEDGTVIWYVIAAWVEEKEFCGVEFGFEDYQAEIFTFLEFGPCFPVSGLEIPYPTGVWPAPLSGVALTRTGGVNWTGNYVPVYYFAGYTYGTYTGLIEIGPDPATDFIGFSNCAQPPQQPSIDEDAQRGAMGINQDGRKAAPVYDPSGACCVGIVCTIKTESDCLAQAGEPYWLGEGTTCTPNPCDPERVCCFGDPDPVNCAVLKESVCDERQNSTWYPELLTCDPNPCTPTVTAACCIPGTGCIDVTADSCDTYAGASWHSGYACAVAQCDSLGACCFDTEPYCRTMWREECQNAHGVQSFPPHETWHPGQTCGVDDKCFPNPVEESSWGRIKKIYQ